MRFKVYESILNNAPCTSAEALSNMLSKNSAITSSRARFTELRELGVIYEKGIKKCTITGKNVIEWDLTDKLPIKPEKLITAKQQRVEDTLNALRVLYKNKITSNVFDWQDLADLIKKI